MKNTLATGAAFTIVPSFVLGGCRHTAPSDKVNLAVIGAGGRGSHITMLADMWEVDREARDLDITEHEALAGKWNGDYEFRSKKSFVNIVGLCDVNPDRAATARKIHPNAGFFSDYRRMLDKIRGDIDGVMIAPPDHSHFHATLTAMQMGLHVYTEKPLTRFVGHARRLQEAALKYNKVVTQMGNQGHSNWSTARTRDWILNGAIGDVCEVVAWNEGNYSTLQPPTIDPLPVGLDYDLWLNREPYRPYHKGPWRIWSNWSSGTLGDFGCHTLDAAFYALNLTAPESVEAEIAGGWPVPDSFPSQQMITWHMPARDNKPPVRVRYFMMDRETLQKRVLPLIQHLPPDTNLSKLFRFGRGAAIIGEKATIIYGGWGATSRIVPDLKAQEIGFAPEKSPRVDGHMRSWIRACKGEGETLSNFNYAGPLAEMVLLGDVALRSREKAIHWDAKSMKVTNDEQANQIVRGPEPRTGWEI